MANDAQMPERIWYHPDGAYLSCQPAEHEGWQEFVLSDLCASGQQVRALMEALRELVTACEAYPVNIARADAALDNARAALKGEDHG